MVLADGIITNYSINLKLQFTSLAFWQKPWKTWYYEGNYLWKVNYQGKLSEET